MRGRDFSRQNIQNYDYQAPFRGERGAGKAVVEKQVKPQIQEVKKGQIDAKADIAKIPEIKRQTSNSEHKNTPIKRLTSSEQAQKLMESHQTIEPLVVAVKPASLDRKNTVNGERPVARVVILNEVSKAFLFPEKKVKDLKIRNNLEISRSARNDNALQEQIQKAPEIASSPAAPRNDVLTGLRIVTGAEAQAVLLVGETEQMHKTYAALAQAFNPEQAQVMLAEAIKTKTKAMSLPEQAQILEEMVKSGQAEGLRDDPELILRIIAKKEITQEEIEAQVYEPAMRARLANLETSASELEQESDEATGSELIAKLGAETNAERSPIAPDGKNDGGYDIAKAKTASLGKRKIQTLYEAAKANILANPAAEYVRKVVTRRATDEEVHNIIFAQQELEQIIRFALDRGRAMLAKMQPV